MTAINPAFIQAAKAYDFVIEYCEETDKTIIKSKDNRDAFWWDSTYDEDDFWRDLKVYFHDQGYHTAARW